MLPFFSLLSLLVFFFVDLHFVRICDMSTVVQQSGSLTLSKTSSHPISPGDPTNKAKLSRRQKSLARGKNRVTHPTTLLRKKVGQMTAGSKELRRGEGKRCSWTLLLSFRSFPPRNEETGSKDSPKGGGGKQPKSCFFTFRAKTIGHQLTVQWSRLFGERRQSAKALPEGPKKVKKTLFLPSFLLCMHTPPPPTTFFLR